MRKPHPTLTAKLAFFQDKWRQWLGSRAARAQREELERRVAIRTAELARALEDARAATRAKSDFLAHTSHEIRTSMNGVIGMLDLLRDEHFSTQQRSMLDTARNSAEALLGVINNILDFSKLEAGRLTLEHIEVELRPLVEEVATLFARQAHAKGIELSCVIHQDVPAVVRTDPTRLRQILSNLMSNAVKFTAAGEVFLGIRGREQQATDSTLPLQIVVRDTGIGIPEEAKARLFEAFTQADVSTTRKYGGTGLGLAITQGLIQAMHGTIRVGSEPGKGSTFSVILPFEIAARASDTPHADLQGLKALVVDDNITSRCILEHYLIIAGMQHESAESAAAGLEAARAAAVAGAPFNVVVVDYEMPEVDGLGFLETLRADPALGATPCVVLSSLGDRVPAAEQLGVSAWLGKPVRQTQLRSTLESLLGQATARQEPAAARKPTPEAAFVGARVLLVEDNAVNQKVAQRMLETFCIRSRLAINGQEALQALGEEEFDLILMDCQMPVMDGYAATAAVREWETQRGREHIPIVAMTANAMQGDRERCLAAGMDGYLAKPVKRNALGAVLKQWLPPNPALRPQTGAMGTAVAGHNAL